MRSPCRQRGPRFDPHRSKKAALILKHCCYAMHIILKNSPLTHMLPITKTFEIPTSVFLFNVNRHMYFQNEDFKNDTNLGGFDLTSASRLLNSSLIHNFKTLHLF
jgi:hypothetical protein